MAKGKADSARAADVIKNWIRTRTNLEFLGTWEKIYNPNFKVVEFDHFKSEAGLPFFVLSPSQWVKNPMRLAFSLKLDAMVAPTPTRTSPLNLAPPINPAFKLYLIKEFQRLKYDENDRLSLSWDLNRTLPKINFHIHTDAIKAELIPAKVSKAQTAATYASEADLLNVARFSYTAKKWREAKPELKGNIRYMAAAPKYNCRIYLALEFDDDDRILLEYIMIDQLLKHVN